MKGTFKLAALMTVGTAALLAALAGKPSAAPAEAGACPTDAGLSLPPGFCATVFADNIGHARHLVVAPDGTVYVNTWSGGFYRDTPPSDGFLVALRDADADGHAESVTRFGPRVATGATGGTGIALYKGALYADEKDTIVRYPLKPGESVPSSAPSTIVSGLPMTGDHKMRPFVIARDGTLFVNSGSASNTCENPPRQPGSTGTDPCTELETRAGLWAFDANRTGQIFTPAARYATGLRNSGGQAFDAAGRLFATQHGRDQLAQNWPKLFTASQGAELPAEELVQVTPGADFGWPKCYYDGFQNKLVLAPEYGGDGKEAGLCARKTPPIAAFPAHWAPNDLLFYTGSRFPTAWRNGAFIAFHGSWNRAPQPQDGFNIVFQPLADGRASGRYLLFADGFAGPGKAAGQAQFRPAGLAQGPDGALYVADDNKGRIWRITYNGPANAALAAARPTATAGQSRAAPASASSLPVPPGFTADQVALGNRIFHGEERDGTCSGCHGADGKGAAIGPALTGPTWLWADGSVPSLARVIAEGVPNPKKFAAGMPAKGGAPLSDSDVQAVAAYVWALGRRQP